MNQSNILKNKKILVILAVCNTHYQMERKYPDYLSFAFAYENEQ